MSPKKPAKKAIYLFKLQTKVKLEQKTPACGPDGLTQIPAHEEVTILHHVTDDTVFVDWNDVSYQIDKATMATSYS